MLRCRLKHGKLLDGRSEQLDMVLVRLLGGRGTALAAVHDVAIDERSGGRQVVVELRDSLTRVCLDGAPQLRLVVHNSAA